MREHRVQFRSWETVSSHKVKGHQVLGCQWVFKYKTDKHDCLQKCKARLVICGNQQKHHGLPTRPTTLAITSLCVLLALTAKFDLKTIQLDAVNAYVHANLDETVFMRIPPGYGKNGFKEIPQEQCVVLRNGIIAFFYLDDIVFAYKKNPRKDEVDRVVDSLQRTLTIKKVGELKWFLGLHVVCNQTKQTIWLSQKAYIAKICNELAPMPTGQPPTTPMDTTELPPLSDKEEVSDTSRTLYQQKVGSLLFAAIATRPDIAFAVSRLSRFNQRPRKNTS